MTGMTKFRLGHIGEYDQCIGIRSPARENNRTIYGKYCLIQPFKTVPPLSTYRSTDELLLKQHPPYQTVKSMLNTSGYGNYVNHWKNPVQMLLSGAEQVDKNLPVYGICIPAGCKSRDIQNLINACKSFFLWNKAGLFSQCSFCSFVSDDEISGGSQSGTM